MFVKCSVMAYNANCKSLIAYRLKGGFMQFRFEKLEVWKQAREFCSFVYSITKCFPSSERFCLNDQLRRASISVVLNVAEGSNRKSDPDFVRFLKIAQASVCEVVAGMYVAYDQSYIGDDILAEVNSRGVLLSSRITATIKAISNEQ